MHGGVEIIIVEDTVTRERLQPLMDAWHGVIVKGVADIERGIIALGGEWHMDANVKLIEAGSLQEHVWGFNVYPDDRGDAAIEYVSLINIRPAQGNRDMEIESADVRQRVRDTIMRLMPFLGV